MKSGAGGGPGGGHHGSGDTLDCGAIIGGKFGLLLVNYPNDWWVELDRV